MLHEAGYSLQGNTKTREGNQHPDRDAQFRYLKTGALEESRRDPGTSRAMIQPSDLRLIEPTFAGLRMASAGVGRADRHAVPHAGSTRICQ